MNFTEAVTNVEIAQWFGIFLAIPVSIVIIGALYETILKIYWKHKIRGEEELAKIKNSVRLATDKVKRDELAKERK